MMGDFFKGWRRKIGVVTLVMATTLMGAWIRSEYVSDMFFWWTDKSTHSQYSSLGHFGWRSDFQMTPIDPRTIANWHWRSFSGPKRPQFPERLGALSTKWAWSCGTLRISEQENFGITSYFLTVPYSPVAISLTVLSAILILWRPRSAKQKKMVDPAPQKQA